MPRSQQVGVPEQYASMDFPLNGLDLTTEFELQRPGTTPVGKNVRAYEALTQRGRGGSRPGLVKYLPQQVSGPHLIQHLNYLVDPSADALMTQFDPLDGQIATVGVGLGFVPFSPSGFYFGFPNFGMGFPQILPATFNPGAPGAGFGGIPDPSTNIDVGFGARSPGQRYVPTGGNGIQLNRNVATKKKQPPSPIQFVQAKGKVFGEGITFGLTFNSNVGLGDLFALIIGYTYLPTSVVSVTDTFGNAYQRAAVVQQNGPNGFHGLELWYGLSSHTGANQVTFVLSPAGPAWGAVLEYSGVTQSLPFDGGSATSDQTGLLAMTTGPAAIHGPGEVLIGAFKNNVGNGSTLDPGFNTRFQASNFTVGDKLGLAVPTAMTGTQNIDNGTPWVGVAASFIPQVQ